MRTLQRNGRQRIDGRPQSSWATQAGLRSVHRDMHGNVIGGIAQDGRGIGAKADRQASLGWQSKVAGSPRMAASPEPIAPAPYMPETSWSTNVDPGMTPSGGREALGTAASPRATAPAPVSKINGVPAKQAIAEARVGAEKTWQGKVAPQPVKFGADIAANNIATKGIDAAVSDYQARSRTEAARPFTTAAATPAAPKRSWQEAVAPVKPAAATAARTGGLEGTIASIRKSRAETEAMLPKPPAPVATATPASVPTPNFSVAPATDYKPVAPSAQPPPAVPQSPRRSFMTPTGANFVGNEPPRAPSATWQQRMALANADLEQRRKIATKFTDEKPTWRGTGFGKVMDILSKPAL